MRGRGKNSCTATVSKRTIGVGNHHDGSRERFAFAAVLATVGATDITVYWVFVFALQLQTRGGNDDLLFDPSTSTSLNLFIEKQQQKGSTESERHQRGFTLEYGIDEKCSKGTNDE